MKKACSLPVSAFLIAALALPVSAASPEHGEAAEILPIDVILDQEAVEIRKIYSLSPSTNPEALPREGFDRDGYHYECSDILREVVMGSETQPLTQTETVESKNKEMETLLALLPQKKPVTTEDRGEREATGQSCIHYGSKQEYEREGIVCVHLLTRNRGLLKRI